MKYIDAVIMSNGRIIVNCELGISRSATIVIAYVMLKFNGQVNPCFIVPNENSDEYTYLVSPIRQVY